MRIDPDICRDPDLLAAEVRRLQAVIDAMTVVVTDDPPEAVETAGDVVSNGGKSVETGNPDGPEAIATGDNDRPEPIGTPNLTSTPAECTVPGEWTSRPYWVDPPSGWRYGFPRLYDPSQDGDMTAWMIRNGYPERLARLGLPCTFTAMTEDGEK